MIKVLSILLFIIFGTLAGFHFYWFMGGTWALNKVIPSKGKTASSITIPKFATLLVGLVLFSFGVFYLIPSLLQNSILAYVYYFIPALFILRSIGEFKYVGFFKKIKDTEFAKADSQIFSPLCLFIGVVGIVILLLT